MVLSVNRFQNELQKGAFDADFSILSAAGFGMTTRRRWYYRYQTSVSTVALHCTNFVRCTVAEVR